MTDLVYVFVDVEVDGPDPGKNSLRSLAAVAFSAAGTELREFTRNLQPLKGAEPEPVTLRWWQSQPAPWAEITRDAEVPDLAMIAFAGWVQALPGAPVFAAHPLVFDGSWMDWYLRRYTGTRLFGGPFAGRSLFVGAGIDIPSYVQAALGMDYFRERPDYPADLLDGFQHTHRALGDARGHAALYFNARRRVLGR